MHIFEVTQRVGEIKAMINRTINQKQNWSQNIRRDDWST